MPSFAIAICKQSRDLRALTLRVDLHWGGSFCCAVRCVLGASRGVSTRFVLSLVDSCKLQDSLEPAAGLRPQSGGLERGCRREGVGAPRDPANARDSVLFLCPSSFLRPGTIGVTILGAFWPCLFPTSIRQPPFAKLWPRRPYSNFFAISVRTVSCGVWGGLFVKFLAAFSSGNRSATISKEICLNFAVFFALVLKNCTRTALSGITHIRQSMFSEHAIPKTT